MTELRHFPAHTPPEEIAAFLRDNGYAIIDKLVDDAKMDRIAAETGPYIEDTPVASDSFLGKTTRRTGALIARSPESRALVMNPTVLGVASRFLDHASAYRLHLTQIISVEPGSPAQPIHRDELAWDFFPFPTDYQVQCNTLWAMSDYTAEMGATRVVPNSQGLSNSEKFTQEDSLPAEMERGSVLLYTGKIYHGAGANVSDKVRQAINITYAVGWVRQEENQYLATPPEIAVTLDDDLLKVMGYQLGGFAMGYVRDFEDPLAVLRGGRSTPIGFEAAEKAVSQGGSAEMFASMVDDPISS